MSPKVRFIVCQFNTDALCHKCLAEERQHPDYKLAVDAELETVRAGDWNFECIGWRGKLIAVCAYEVSYTPGPPIWNEGYPVWWHLTNVHLLDEPFSCRGNVGMWVLPEDIVQVCNKKRFCTLNAKTKYF